MKEIYCSSTKERIANDEGNAQFPCPKCGEETIVRSARARKLGMKYSCSKCGFTGPN